MSSGPDWTRLFRTPAATVPPAPVVAPTPAPVPQRTKAEQVQQRKANAVIKRRENQERVARGEGLPAGQNPTTSEIDYTSDETEFMMALDRYKREKRRQFPTSREILWVVLGLGYRKRTQGATDGGRTHQSGESTEQAVGQDPLRLPRPDA